MHILYTRNAKNLAVAVAQKLNVQTSEPIVRIFANQEMVVSIQDKVDSAIIVACLKNHDDWIELFFTIDALRSAGKAHVDVSLYISYLGYGRQTERQQQQSCGSMFFANILDGMNIKHVVTINNHNSVAFLHNAINFNAMDVFLDDIKRSFDAKDTTIVAPDIGIAKDLAFLARRLQMPIVICNKHRNIFGEVSKTELIGEIRTKNCVVIDDIVDSGSTLAGAAKAVIAAGGENVYAYVTHGLFSKAVCKELTDSNLNHCKNACGGFAEFFKHIVITDTIEPCKDILEMYQDKMRILSVKDLIAQSIYTYFCDINKNARSNRH